MSLTTTLCPKIRLPQFCYKPESEFSSIFITRNSQQHDCSYSLFPPANQSVAAIVFGDGSAHSRLYPLTKRRSEAAIPIAGNYRLVDAVVSNCINSNITKIYALTQYNSTSLNSHLSRAYSGAHLSKEGVVEVIAAYQSTKENGWFQGTADAIRRCLWVLEEYPVLEFLILPGHHIYKMDYQKLIDTHRKSKTDITVSVLRRNENEDLGFGIYKLNAENQVVEYRESPEMTTLKSTDVQKRVNFDNEICVSPSMGIYVINRDIMVKLLNEYFPTSNDVKSEVIPGAISLGMKIHAYQFDGCWEDMRNIGAYYKANMEIIQRPNKAYYNFYDRESPLYTLPRNLPPTLVTDAIVTDSIIADGCILSQCRIKSSVVGMRTRVCDRTVIEDSIILGSDSYHQNGITEGEDIGIPIGIGEDSLIRKSIIDKNARIGKNVMIINKDNVQEANMEANGYIITEGIVVIIRSAVIPDGSIV